MEPPCEVDLMMNKEAEKCGNEFRQISKQEFDDIIQHTKKFGYAPDLTQRRQLYHTLRKLKRQKLIYTHSCQINERIDEINARIRESYKNEKKNQKKNKQILEQLLLKKKLGM